MRLATNKLPNIFGSSQASWTIKNESPKLHVSTQYFTTGFYSAADTFPLDIGIGYRRDKNIWYGTK